VNSSKHLPRSESGGEVIPVSGPRRAEATGDFGDYSLWRCEFAFAVLVPANSPFYAVEVSYRDERTYSNAEMAAENWAVAFSLD
jgi:hypothetical protein